MKITKTKLTECWGLILDHNINMLSVQVQPQVTKIDKVNYLFTSYRVSM